MRECTWYGRVFCGLAEPVSARSQILFEAVLCGSAAGSQPAHSEYALSAGGQVGGLELAHTKSAEVF